MKKKYTVKVTKDRKTVSREFEIKENNAQLCHKKAHYKIDFPKEEILKIEDETGKVVYNLNKYYGFSYS